MVEGVAKAVLISTIPEEEIKRIESVLTIVGGKGVYGSEEFASLAPPSLPVSPDWSPVGTYGGYHRDTAAPGKSIRRAAIIPTDRSGCRKSAGSGGSAVTASPFEN